jgi:hypothetical protein
MVAVTLLRHTPTFRAMTRLGFDVDLLCGNLVCEERERVAFKALSPEKCCALARRVFERCRSRPRAKAHLEPPCDGDREKHVFAEARRGRLGGRRNSLSQLSTHRRNVRYPLTLGQAANRNPIARSGQRRAGCLDPAP